MLMMLMLILLDDADADADAFCYHRLSCAADPSAGQRKMHAHKIDTPLRFRIKKFATEPSLNGQWPMHNRLYTPHMRMARGRH